MKFCATGAPVPSAQEGWGWKVAGGGEEGEGPGKGYLLSAGLRNSKTSEGVTMEEK